VGGGPAVPLMPCWGWTCRQYSLGRGATDGIGAHTRIVWWSITGEYPGRIGWSMRSGFSGFAESANSTRKAPPTRDPLAIAAHGACGRFAGGASLGRFEFEELG